MAKTCRECGSVLQGRRNRKQFCNSGCRIKFHNRRRDRGSELYDLFMALRYDRDVAKEEGIWSLMCNMAMTWKEEDEARGRTSHFSTVEACQHAAKYRAKKYRI